MTKNPNSSKLTHFNIIFKHEGHRGREEKMKKEYIFRQDNKKIKILVSFVFLANKPLKGGFISLTCLRPQLH